MSIMTFNEQYEKIIEQLNSGLPGLKAQFQMAPGSRKKPSHEWIRPENAKVGAVLLLLYPHKGNLQVPFIVRQAYEGVHSAQIGFPGGKEEDVDTSLTATALRETEEEIGLSPERINIMGQLSPLYIPPSNFWVQPIVGFLTQKPKFQLDYKEVAGIFDVPLRHFIQPQAKKQATINVRGQIRINTPCFIWRKHIIWGATAMMLNEFVEVARKAIT